MLRHNPKTWTALMQLASETLRLIVKLEARHTVRELGVDYRPTEQAPNTFEAAVAEHLTASATGQPYQVSSLHSDLTIFGDPETNFAMRFWHDMIHVRLGADFTLAGERKVATEHLRILRHGYGLTSSCLAGRLLLIDTLGQNECVHAVGAFPVDQRLFAANALRYGLNGAIEMEGALQNTSRNRASPALRSGTVLVAVSPLRICTGCCGTRTTRASCDTGGWNTPESTNRS